MNLVAKTFGSIKTAALWLLWTILTRRQMWGAMWITGRPARERELIRRLLAEYPALADQPSSRLNEIADGAIRPLGYGQPLLVFLTATIVTGIIASALWSVLYGLGAPLPGWTRGAMIALSALAVGEIVRRWYIRGEMSRAIAAVYPALFCPCGYCLVGLRDDAPRCPECGAARADVGPPG
jgi:hypothetical protein